MASSNFFHLSSTPAVILPPSSRNALETIRSLNLLTTNPTVSNGYTLDTSSGHWMPSSYMNVTYTNTNPTNSSAVTQPTRNDENHILPANFDDLINSATSNTELDKLRFYHSNISGKARVRSAKQKPGRKPNFIGVKLYHLPAASEKPRFTKGDDPLVVRHFQAGYGYSRSCYNEVTRKIKKYSLNLNLNERQLRAKMFEMFSHLSEDFKYYTLSQGGVYNNVVIKTPMDIKALSYSGTIVLINGHDANAIVATSSVTRSLIGTSSSTSIHHHVVPNVTTGYSELPLQILNNLGNTNSMRLAAQPSQESVLTNAPASPTVIRSFNIRPSAAPIHIETTSNIPASEPFQDLIETSPPLSSVVSQTDFHVRQPADFHSSAENASSMRLATQALRTAPQRPQESVITNAPASPTVIRSFNIRPSAAPIQIETTSNIPSSEPFQDLIETSPPLSSVESQNVNLADQPANTEEDNDGFSRLLESMARISKRSDARRLSLKILNFHSKRRDLVRHMETNIYQIVTGRETVFKTALEHYSRSDILNCKLDIVFEGENGRDNDGLTREFFSLFWSEFFKRYCVGADSLNIIVPITESISENDFIAVGRVLIHGFILQAYLPVALNNASLFFLLTGETASDGFLVQQFIACLDNEDRNVVNNFLSSKSLNSQEKLKLSLIFSKFARVTGSIFENSAHLVKSVAERVSLVIPYFFLAQIKKGVDDFIDRKKLFLYFDEHLFSQLLSDMQPDGSDLVKKIKFEKSDDGFLSAQEDYIEEIFQEFVTGMSRKEIKEFLRFVTGYEVLSETIYVEFNGETNEMKMIPHSHTCTRTLHLSRYITDKEHLKLVFGVALSKGHHWSFGSQ